MANNRFQTLYQQAEFQREFRVFHVALASDDGLGQLAATIRGHPLNAND